MNGSLTWWVSKEIEFSCQWESETLIFGVNRVDKDQIPQKDYEADIWSASTSLWRRRANDRNVRETSAWFLSYCPPF